MFFTYILRSQLNRKYYIGYSDDLRRRLKEHNKGIVKSTRPYLPWKIIYFEAYSTEDEARHREDNLKLRANAWNQLKRRIRKSLNT